MLNGFDNDNYDLSREIYDAAVALVRTCLFTETSAGSGGGALLHDVHITIHRQVSFMPSCSTAKSAFRERERE